MLTAAKAFNDGRLSRYMLHTVLDTAAQALIKTFEAYNKTLPDGTYMAKVYQHPTDEHAVLIGWLDGSANVIQVTSLTVEEAEELNKIARAQS